MSTILSREFAADIEIRSDGTGRTVHGLIVPYNREATVSDGFGPYREMFAPGAFARDIAGRGGNFGRVKFLYQHDRHEPLGRATELRDDAAGVYGAFRISATRRGDEVLEMLRDGVLDSFSVGFAPIAPAAGDPIPVDGVVVRTESALREASVVTFAAYADALVGGVRQESKTSDDRDLVEEADPGTRSDQPEPSDPEPSTASAPPLGGLTPAQRRERLFPYLTPKE